MSTYAPQPVPGSGSDVTSPELRWSPLQRELLCWLKQHVPALMEPYVAAITLLQGPTFPGRLTLICFCMRDLGNILPRARNVDEKAQQHGQTSKSVNSSSDKLSGAKRKARALLKALPQLDGNEEDVASWIDDVHRLLKWFSDHHHFSHEQREWPPDADLEQNVALFERALLKSTSTFFGLLREVEKIIKSVSSRGGPPTNREADQLVAVLDWSPELEQPLLDRLGTSWLPALRDRRRFVGPPATERVQDGGVRYPNWPASKYLARMAQQAPSDVAEIFTKIETDNPSIIGDMLEAALAMPENVGATLVPAVCRAAQVGTLWMHFKGATDLCLRLAEGGELDAAMPLAEALFTPTFEEGQEEPSRRDKYWYKEGLKKAVPILARAKAKEFLPKLCDWLKASVEANGRVDPESGSDSSYIWRPAIEEHGQNHDYDFAGAMVGFVREGFEEAIRNGSLLLEEAFHIVERYPYLVFRRIRLHLIGEFADQNPDLARQTILNREMFDDYEYKHEYAMLMGRRFDLLSPKQRKKWFGWIDAGPKGEDYTKEQAEYWTFKKLHWARAHLEGERKAFYERMLAEHGEPQMADMNVYVGEGRWGNDSPMTVEQLAGMTFEKAVDKVSSWTPDKPRFMGPDMEGLASTFKQYVATKPEEFSAQAKVMMGRPAIFVRGFISQMGEAVKAGQEIDLAAVLELCHWVMKRPVGERTTPEQEDEGIVDKDWQWTRDDVSQFVENICKAKSGDVPKYPLQELRQPLWQLIASLYRDRAGSYVVHDIAKDDPRVRDYLDTGINSPRGKAVKAALEYARWVANHIKKSKEGQEIIPGGFNAMPEVREVLQWQISPENRSFEAMSIIGSRIGLIYWIDKAWLTENAGQLFRLEDIEKTPPAAHGWAAWNAFLVWVRPHIEFYKLFKVQFAYAVRQAAQVRLAEKSHQQPMNYLGEHLMILYGSGQLGLDEDKGLLKRFLTNTNPDIRRHAIGFVGQTLEGDEKAPSEVVARFRTLWEVYWAGAGRKDAEEKPDAWLFGTWFASGQFQERWALKQLEQFVEVVPTPEPDHAVVEQLAKIAQTDIVKAVCILDRMVRGDREGWRMHGWLDSAKSITEQAMKIPGEAREQAKALIDYLGRRGYTEFGKLLKE